MSKSAGPDYETVSPYAFVKTLPTCAQNEIPSELGNYCSKANYKAWNILEEGVFSLFRHVFLLQTIKLGGKTLFKHEPEGIVLWDRCGTKNAFLYECKARKAGYSISSDDVLRYKDYVGSKKHFVSVKYHLPLSHFIIVSSEFHGDIEARLKEFDTVGITLSLVEADQLAYLYETTKGFDYEDFHLLNLPKIFCRGKVGTKAIDDGIKSLP
jgi:hypothetical protein